jgi:hypothetical protein
VQASIVKLVEAVHGTLQAQKDMEAARSRSQSSEVRQDQTRLGLS